MSYLIKKGCSTRKSPDPRGKLWDEFYSYRPGDIVEKFPEWVPINEWLASEHISKVDVVEPSKKMIGAEE